MVVRELDHLAPPYADEVSRRAELAHALLDTAISLGALDWRTRGLAGFGQPEGFHQRQVNRWSAMLASSTTRTLPGADVATAWLKRARPIGYIPGLSASSQIPPLRCTPHD